MTIEEIQTRIKAIDEIQRDYEKAHSDEDDLMMDFVLFVSNSGVEPLALMAREILKVKELDFPRYCA